MTLAEKGYFRIGKISSFDYPKGTAKITYEDKGDSTTAFFSFLAYQYWMPKIGDQVMVAHLSNGTCAATILGPVWHDGHRPPEGFEGLYRKDFNREYGEAYERYDHNTGLYTIHIGDVTVDLKADGSVAITAPSGVTVTAPNVTINGNLSVNGSETVTGDVTAGGISLQGHTHTGVHGETSTPH